MRRRRLFFFVVSVGISAGLIAFLSRLGTVDPHTTFLQLRNVRPQAFFGLVLLNCLLVLISTEKWRNVDAALRFSSEKVPSRTTAFAVTASGMAAGILLPVQLGMTVARTFGGYFHGRPLKRGTAATLFEQSFDILTGCLLAAASGLTWVTHGGIRTWLIAAAAMIAASVVLIGFCISAVRWMASRVSPVFQNSATGAKLKNFFELQESGILSAALARRLIIFSTLRFGVVVLMAKQTAECIGAPIPIWQLAAAIPFVLFATAIAFTPGGIGFAEVTYAGALACFGTPLHMASDWALINRALTIVSCFAVAACAVVFMGIGNLAVVGSLRTRVRQG